MKPLTVFPPTLTWHTFSLLGINLWEEHGGLTWIQIPSSAFTWGMILSGSVHVLRALEQWTSMGQGSWSTSHRALRSLQALGSCLFHVPNSFYIRHCIRVCVFVISCFNKLSCGRRCWLFFVSSMVHSTALCPSIGVLPISIELSWSGVMWLRCEIWEALVFNGASGPLFILVFPSSHFLASIFTSFILRKRQAHFKELTSKSPWPRITLHWSL